MINLSLVRVQQSPFLRNPLPILILLLLPFLVFWQVWAPNAEDRLIFSGDILVAAYPTRLFVHRLFDGGINPLWNPYQLGGMPLLGDVQVAPYYSLNLVLDFLYRGQPIPYMAMELMTIAHYAIGGLFFYGYLRGLGLRPVAALIGAISFEFNGFFIGHRGHYNMLGVVVWLPGILWLLDQAWRSQGIKWATLWATLAGLTLSQMVMAGHPQLTLYCSLMIMGYFLYRLTECLRTRCRTTWFPALRNGLIFGYAGLLGGGIAAIALFPAAELLGRSLRSAPTYAFAAEYSLLPRNFIGLLMPDFLGWGVTEYRIYAGILTILLAIVACTVPTKARQERSFFIAVVVLALLFSLGGFTILYGIIYRFVPGFSAMRVSARAFYLANMALSVLAAFGAETLLRPLTQSERKRLRQTAIITSIVVVIVILLGTGFYFFLLRNYQPVNEDFFFPENLFNYVPNSETPFATLTQATNSYLLFLIFLAGAVTLLWARLYHRLANRTLAISLCLLMFLDVATYAPYHDTIAADPEHARFAVKAYNTTILQEQWQIRDQDQLIEALQQLPPYIRTDNHDEVLPDNHSAVYQIAFATGYNILDLQERFQLLNQWPYLSPTVRHDLLNTGYILASSASVEPPEAGAHLQVENSQGKLWKRSTQPSYARFSTQLRPVETLITVNGLLSLPAQTIATQPSIAMSGTELRSLLAQQWPETVQPSLYQIGTTGLQSPVDITVLAGGPMNYSAVVIDGKTVTPQQRGIVLALIDPQSGAVTGSYGFDTYLSSAESNRFAAVINAAEAGTIVALATYDEGTANFTNAAQHAIEQLGATTRLNEQYGAAYALIGIKGATAGNALERIDEDAITLDIGMGAYHATTDTAFRSEVLTYQPNQITLAVHNTVHGLLTVSEAFYPGWQVYIDGEPATILRANGLQRAVLLPPSVGDTPHEVTFRYAPLSVRLGAAITIGMLSIALAILLAIVTNMLFGLASANQGQRRQLGEQDLAAVRTTSF